MKHHDTILIEEVLPSINKMVYSMQVRFAHDNNGDNKALIHNKFYKKHLDEEFLKMNRL